MASIRLSQELIDAYADLSHDRNPLHVDPIVAASGPFDGTVAHGFLLLGPMLADLMDTAVPLAVEVRFRAPGRPGMEIKADWDSTSERRRCSIVSEGHVLVEVHVRPGSGAAS